MIIIDEIKKSNRKTLAIKVDNLGRVIVYCPNGCSDKRIEKFVHEKENWIEKSKNRVLLTNYKYDTTNLKIGDEIYLLGEKYQLQIGNSKKIEICDKYLILPVNYQNNVENHLKKWLKDYGKVYLNYRLDIIANKMGIVNYSFKISSARGKWGSCSKDNLIMLNFRLMECPVTIIDYIITHELCHILQFNHSKQFYRNLEYYYPDSKLYIKWLKDNAGILGSY